MCRLGCQHVISLSNITELFTGMYLYTIFFEFFQPIFVEIIQKTTWTLKSISTCCPTGAKQGSLIFQLFSRNIGKSQDLLAKLRTVLTI